MFPTDFETIRALLQEASLAGLGVGFLTGLVFSFNPVSFASVPVALAYVTKARSQRQALALGGAFVAGMIATHVVLGVAAALGGQWAKDTMGHEWELLLGPLLIVLGLVWPGWLRVRLPWLSPRGHHVAGVWGAFLLGIPFSVAFCPFCTPALVVMLICVRLAARVCARPQCANSARRLEYRLAGIANGTAARAEILRTSGGGCADPDRPVLN